MVIRIELYKRKGRRRKAEGGRKKAEGRRKKAEGSGRKEEGGCYEVSTFLLLASCVFYLESSLSLQDIKKFVPGNKFNLG